MASAPETDKQQRRSVYASKTKGRGRGLLYPEVSSVPSRCFGADGLDGEPFCGLRTRGYIAPTRKRAQTNSAR